MTGIVPAGRFIISAATYLNNQLEKYQDEKTRDFFNGIIRNFRDGALTAEEFQENLEKQLNASIEQRDRILKLTLFSYRALLDSVDDRVLPALCRLTAQYLDKISSGNLPHITVAVDPFYRGLCRLLSDLSGDEFEEFKTFTSYMKDAPKNTKYLYIDYVPGAPLEKSSVPEQGPLVGVWIRFCIANSAKQGEVYVGQMQHIERWTGLLIRNGFEVSAWEKRIAQSAHGAILARLDFPAMLRISTIVLP